MYLLTKAKGSQGELIGWDSNQRPSVSPSVHPFTLSNRNISETRNQVEIKFHLEHYWARGKLTFCFCQTSATKGLNKGYNC